MHDHHRASNTMCELLGNNRLDDDCAHAKRRLQRKHVRPNAMLLRAKSASQWLAQGMVRTPTWQKHPSSGTCEAEQFLLFPPRLRGTRWAPRVIHACISQGCAPRALLHCPALQSTALQWATPYFTKRRNQSIHTSTLHFATLCHTTSNSTKHKESRLCYTRRLD